MTSALRAASHAAAAARVSGVADARPAPRACCRAAGPPAAGSGAGLLVLPGACARRRRRHAARLPPRAALDVEPSRSRAASRGGAASPLSRLLVPASEALSPAEARAASPQAPAAALPGATWRPLACSAAGVSPPPAPPSPPDSEYYLQCGLAIRTLRDELPAMFERDLSYDIYRDDISFIDRTALPGVPAEAHGLDAYKRVFLSMRLHGALCFSRQRVTLLRIWQPRDRTLAVRWSVCAAPRLLSSLGADDSHFDGISEYKLDARGMIYAHTVDNVDAGTQAPLRNRTLAAMLAGLSPAQSPTPSFCRGDGADVARARRRG